MSCEHCIIQKTPKIKISSLPLSTFTPRNIFLVLQCYSCNKKQVHLHLDHRWLLSTNGFFPMLFSRNDNDNPKTSRGSNDTHENHWQFSGVNLADDSLIEFFMFFLSQPICCNWRPFEICMVTSIDPQVDPGCFIEPTQLFASNGMRLVMLAQREWVFWLLETTDASILLS